MPTETILLKVYIDTMVVLVDNLIGIGGEESLCEMVELILSRQPLYE